MAVDANTYGTVARVERQVGDLVTSRLFTTSTTPTKAQVEAALDDVAAEINAELDYMNYSVPVLTADDPHAFNFLRAANTFGAAALVLGMLPAEAYTDPENDSLASGRKEFLEKKLWQAVKRIREGRLRATMRESRLADFRIGSQKDSDGNTNLPLFTRGGFRYPNTESLTET